jgi:hypothetical protein
MRKIAQKWHAMSNEEKQEFANAVSELEEKREKDWLAVKNVPARSFQDTIHTAQMVFEEVCSHTNYFLIITLTHFSASESKCPYRH